MERRKPEDTERWLDRTARSRGAESGDESDAAAMRQTEKQEGPPPTPAGDEARRFMEALSRRRPSRTQPTIEPEAGCGCRGIGLVERTGKIRTAGGREVDGTFMAVCDCRFGDERRAHARREIYGLESKDDDDPF